MAISYLFFPGSYKAIAAHEDKGPVSAFHDVGFVFRMQAMRWLIPYLQISQQAMSNP